MKEHYISNEMISRAHQLRNDMGFTLQGIVDEAEKIKMPVSMSTVRRFFADDATKHRFTDETVQGIFAVLGQTNDKTEGDTTPDQVDFLKDIIAFDRELIEELEEKIVSIRAQYENEINKIQCAHSEQFFNTVTEYQQRLDFLKDTIEDFKRQIEVKDRHMEQHDNHFMDQIAIKDRRYDILHDKYEALMEKHDELLQKLIEK